MYCTEYHPHLPRDLARRSPTDGAAIPAWAITVRCQKYPTVVPAAVFDWHVPVGI
jgi:hypothetical protein